MYTKRNQKIIGKLGLVVLYVVEGVVLTVMLASLFGCMGKYGVKNTDYAEACELPPLKMPPDSLAVSKRYDIPEIPGNKELIITDSLPPDYY